MPDSWAIFGLDLHLDLAGPQVRAGLEGALREAVRGGRLLPGTRLPSSRALATDLGIARNTVADCYAQLVAEGWLAARQGSGTWVADRTPVEALGPADAWARSCGENSPLRSRGTSSGISPAPVSTLLLHAAGPA